MSKIALIGSTSMQLILDMNQIPAPMCTETETGNYGFMPAGDILDLSALFNNFSVTSSICTRIGADSHGQKLMSAFQQRGIDTSLVSIDQKMHTDFSVVMREANGCFRKVFYPGASSNFTTDDILKLMSARPDVIFLRLNMPADTISYVLKMADKNNVTTVIDGNSRLEPEYLAQLPQCEVFVTDIDNATKLTQSRTAGNSGNYLAILIGLVSIVKAKYYVVKNHERGAYIYDGRRCIFGECFPSSKLRDPDDSGDLYTLAFTAEYSRNGKDIKAATKYANAAHILYLQGDAGKPFPPHEEILDFMSRPKS